MEFTQIRHGSHIITYKGKKLLVDPVLAKKGSMVALPMGRVKAKNPLVDMPFGYDFIKGIDGVILTHLHFDHFDDTAKALLPKDIPIYCHHLNVAHIKKDGFVNVNGISESLTIDARILVEVVNGGRHGKGIRKKLMGRTTGFILKDGSPSPTEPTLYIIGDSIWCKEISTAIDTYEPNIIIAYAGEARFFGGKITMSKSDLNRLALYKGNAQIIINHLDSWNHCYLTKEQLKIFVKDKMYQNRLWIPADGAKKEFHTTDLYS